MRKAFVVAAGAVAFFTVAPAVPGYAAPPHAQATGTGTLDHTFGDPTAHINAVQAKPGLKGSFEITYPDGTAVSGKPVCLSVSGNTAYVTGKIDQSSGPRQATNSWLPGNYLVIGVQDNGEPGSADRLNFSTGFTTDPGCGPNSAARPDFTIVNGNYQVFDGS
jgi:hypothetical protein